MYGPAREKLVRDLQIPVEECLLIPAGASVREAAAMLGPSVRQGAAPRTVLVVDDRCRPVGTLRDGDLKTERPAGVNGNVIDLAGAAARRGQGGPSSRAKVTQVMQPIPRTAVEGSASLSEAVRKMVAYGLLFLPVLDNGRVTGVIHAGRILEEAARIMGATDQVVSGR